MSRRPRSAGATVALRALATLAGLWVALIVVLNLHILVGLEEGYAASPAEVLDHSVLLAVVDVVLLIGGPALALRLTRPAGGRRRLPRR